MNQQKNELVEKLAKLSIKNDVYPYVNIPGHIMTLAVKPDINSDITVSFHVTNDSKGIETLKPETR